MTRFCFRGRLLWRLRPRESQAAYLLCCGHTDTTTIARLMGISDQTVKNHKTQMFRKVGAADATQAVLKVWREFMRAHAGGLVRELVNDGC